MKTETSVVVLKPNDLSTVEVRTNDETILLSLSYDNEEDNEHNSTLTTLWIDDCEALIAVLQSSMKVAKRNLEQYQETPCM